MRSQTWPNYPTRPWHPRLSDWSTCGYGGELWLAQGQRCPDPPEDWPRVQVATVSDLRDALDDSNDPTVVLLPPGRLDLDVQLRPVNVPFFLIGHPDGSELRWTKPLSQITGAFSPDGEQTFSHSGGYLQLVGNSEFHARNFTASTTRTAASPHHQEAGWNFQSINGGQDCTSKGLTLINFDSGIFVERGGGHHHTLEDIHLMAGPCTPYQGRYGHHPIEFQRVTDCVAHNVFLSNESYHHASLENASHNVISQWRVPSYFRIDFHRGAVGSGSNLITDCGPVSSTFWENSGPQSKDGYRHTLPGNVIWNCWREDGSSLSVLPSFTATDPSGAVKLWSREMSVIGYKENIGMLESDLYCEAVH